MDDRLWGVEVVYEWILDSCGILRVSSEVERKNLWVRELLVTWDSIGSDFLNWCLLWHYRWELNTHSSECFVLMSNFLEMKMNPLDPVANRGISDRFRCEFGEDDHVTYI